ncbi:MAG: hypothetical protein U0931_28375 [Vulcanimicrobiota bacterium]
MSSGDMDALIGSCSGLASGLSERAVKGLERLVALDQTVAQTETQLQAELGASRNQISQSLRFLQDLENELQSRDRLLHELFSALDQQASALRDKLSADAESISHSSLALAQRADLTLSHLEVTLQRTLESAELVRGAAQSELTQLHHQSAQLNQGLTRLSQTTHQAQGQFQQALAHLLDSHAKLDTGIAHGVDQLQHSCDQLLSGGQQQLAQLEQSLQSLLKTQDGFLDEHLAKALGMGLRQAANSLSDNLNTLEKDLEGITASLTQTHQTFHNNLQKSVVPGVDGISKGLFQAAQSMGMA